MISEGLLIYLTPEQVTTLASGLHSQPSFKWWIIDIAHPQLLKMMTKMWGKGVQGGNAPFLFAPEEGTEYFLPSGWREKTYRGNMEEAKRLKREMGGMWFWQLFTIFYSKKQKEVFKKFSGSVLLERA